MITAGEVLKNKRELLKKSLEKVSLDTKIQKRFLEYIENNQYDYFDSEVFLTGFIKIYAQYLELDTEKVLALYRRSNPKKIPAKPQEKKEEIFGNNKGKKLSKILTPKALFTALLVLFLVSIFGYIGFQIYKFQSPPRLEISQPANEAEFTEETIIVKGETESDAIVEINGTIVETQEGEFEKEITLKEGPNIITVRASKTNTLEKVETIKVTYLVDDIEADDEEKEEEDTELTITLEVFDSAAWVRLDIDDENKVSQVVEPSTLEWTITEKLYVITGRVGNTRILFNDNIIDWQTNQTTGVAELSCEIVETELSCE